MVLHDRRDGTAMQCFPFLHGRNVPEIMRLSLADMVVAGRNPVQPSPEWANNSNEAIIINHKYSNRMRVPGKGTTRDSGG